MAGSRPRSRRTAFASLALLSAAMIVTAVVGRVAVAAQLPVAGPVAPVTTPEQVAVQIVLTGSDADGESLTFEHVDGPAHGDIGAIGAPNCDPGPPSSCEATVTYTPDVDYNGPDVFTYRVDDHADGTSGEEVHITVTPQNDPPVAGGDVAQADEDVPLVIAHAALLANDSDVDAGTTLTVSDVDAASAEGGAIVDNGDQTLTYTPPAEYSGPDSFDYTLSDGSGGTDTATVSITVLPINDPPNALDDEKTVLENSGTAIMDVLDNDTDVEGQAVLVVDATDPDHGTTIVQNGALRYRPDTTFSGVDTFIYTAEDEDTGQDTATVTVTVEPVNTPPDADDENVTGTEDQARNVDVLVGDTDVDGDTLAIVDTTDGAHGTVSIINSGTRVHYLPDPDYNGPDSFTYTVDDGHGGQDTATVTITLTAVNDAPTLEIPFEPVFAEDSGAHSLGGFLDGEAGPPDERLSQAVDFVIDDVTNTALFAALPDVNPNGTVHFTAAPNANGTSTVTAHSFDTGGTANGGVDVSPQGTFTITITPVNDAPTFTVDPTVSVDEDAGAQSIPGFAAGDAGPADEDAAQTVDFAIDDVTAPSMFSVQPAIAANGALTFTPAANASGAATVTVHAHDDGGTANGGVNTSPDQTFTITVSPVNDPPTATDDGVPTRLQIAQNLGPAPIGVLANDTILPDAGETLTIVAVTQGAHGVVAITGGGSGLTYDPTGSYTGTDSFTYTISDGALQATASVLVNVAPDVTAPVTTVRVVSAASRTSSGARVTVVWSALELQSGVSLYQVQQQTDGGTWTTILSSATATRLERVLAGGHTYAFRVRAKDGIGNQGSYATTRPFRL
jgi:hypothetical protein